MAAVTICSDFGVPQNKVWYCFQWWDQIPWSSFSEYWALSQLFHSPPSLSSRGFWFLFAFCHKGGVICISEVTDISPGNLDSSLCFFQPSISPDVPCIEVKLAGWQYTALTYSFLDLKPVCLSAYVQINSYMRNWAFYHTSGEHIEESNSCEWRVSIVSWVLVSKNKPLSSLIEVSFFV